MYSNKKTIVGSLCILFIGWILYAQGIGSVLGIEHAFAAPPAAGKTLTDVIEIMTLLLSILQFLAHLIFRILDFLLDPTFVFDLNEHLKGGSGGQLLLTVWRVSRDIVNVIFAFMLIIGAVVTVVTARGEFIKPYIIKFILAVILVNFSWFFPRVVIDVANVLTATIYQLPSVVGTKCQTWDEKGNKVDCEKITDYEFFVDKCSTGYEDLMGAPIDGTHLVCGKKAKLGPDDTSPWDILQGLVINHAGLPKLIKIKAPGTGPSSNPNKRDQLWEYIVFAVTVAIVFIIHVALIFPLIAMAIVFFIRIPILWLTISFMPFMFLGFVIGDKLGKANTMELIWGHFWKAAFVPTAVAIPLSVGYLMLNAGVESGPPPNFEQALNETKVFLMAGVNNLWALMWLCTALFVMWEGVFMALSIDTIYEKVSGSVKQIGLSWGKFAAKAPLAIPFLPVPGKPGERMSPLEAMKIAKRPDEILLGTGRLKGLEEALRGRATDSQMNTAVRNINKQQFNIHINTIRDSNDPEKIKEALRKLKAQTDAQGINWNAENLQELSRKLGNELARNNKWTDHINNI